MNNIITLEGLAEQLAKRTAITVEQARQYIVDIQQSITNQIATGNDSVSMPYVGTFTVTDSDKGEVAFTPVEPLAEAVNGPFSFFEPVALCADSNELDEVSEPSSHDDNEIPCPPDIIEAEEPAEQEPVEAAIVETEPTHEVVNQESTSEESMEEIVVNEPQYTPEQNNISDTTEDYYDEPQRRGLNPIVAYILGILTGMLLTCIAVYFLYPPLYTGDDEEYIYNDTEAISEDTPTTAAPENEVTSNEENVAPTTPPTPEPAPQNTQPTQATTQASSQVRTDTVSSTYFLASMSRKYYGRMEFWAYIYKENESILGHPDRIPAGTVVVIPEASKYNIDPNSQTSIDDARKLAETIYKKYK